MITLRPYQEAAIDTIMAALPTDENILIQASTGAGKTIVFSELIRRLLSQWPYIRIGILAHRRELITQAQDKLLKVWPDAPIGIACASVDNRVDTDKPVVIGSVQTLVRRTETTAPFDIIICDEAHRIPPMNVKSQYSEFVNTMRRYNPKVRIIGFSATCFRLGHGWTFGTMCKPGNVNLFPDLHYRIGIKELQRDGYLCGYRAKVLADISKDLSSVRKTGDYNVSDLSTLMSKQHHVGSAVMALNEYAADRKHVIVFAVTIAHAEKLCEAFGEQATIVHSELNDTERKQALDDFESGRKRVIVNVGILCEGFDSPATDCIIMCRPTVSPVLFVQQTGRGLRPHPDKKDVLILDLANNCVTHGDPDSPTVVIPKPTKDKKNPLLADKKTKVCPNCSETIPPRAMVCPECGYEFVDENNDPVKLQDYSFQKPKAVTMVLELDDATIVPFTSKRGNHMVKIKLYGYPIGRNFPVTCNHFMMFGDGNHPYAIGKSRALWRKLTGNEPPASAEEALERKQEFLDSLDQYQELIENDKFWNVNRWNVPEPEREEVPF